MLMPTVMITGASRGLGLEFARQYAADGWKVIATCRTPEKSEALNLFKKQFASVQNEKLDVADQNSISVLADKLADEKIDVLINNAGIASGNSQKTGGYMNDAGQIFGTLDEMACNKVMQINSIAPIMVTQAFMPNIRRGKDQKIIMLSSRYGSISSIFDYAPEYIAYCASKAALNMAMRIVANSLKSENIAVASLNPGWVKTDMGGFDANITAEVSVSGMRKVIAGLTIKQTGQFFRYSGETIAW